MRILTVRVLVGVLMSCDVWVVDFDNSVTEVVATLMHDRSVQALTLEVIGNSATTDERCVQANTTDAVAEEHYKCCPLAPSPARALPTYLSVSGLIAR